MTEEEVFTLEDAQNDGLIKSELQDKVPGMVQREFGELVQYYQEACKHTGVPWRIALVDDLVRILNDEAFANQVAETSVELRSVKMAEHRENDLEYIMNLRDKFSEDDELEFDIRGLIQQRLKMTAGGPMGAVANGIGGSSGAGQEQDTRKIIREEVQRAMGEDTVEQSGSSGDSSETVEEAGTVSGDDVEASNRDLLGGSSEETTSENTSGGDPVTPEEGTTNVG